MGVAGAIPGGLTGREAELAQIAEMLAAARDGAGATVLVEGAAGIGKTTLLAAARAEAEAAGMRVLAGRGSALEHEFAMGVVRQCLEPAVHGREELFAGAAEQARSVFAAAPEGRPGSPEQVLHGLYWMTARLAEETPIALVVDDAHWADEASLRFAAYLALRVESLAVVLLVAVRSGEGESAVLRALRESPATRLVVPGALSVADVGQVLGARADGPVEPAFAQACRDATGGNPLLLEELISGLVADDVPFTAAGADRVAETTVPSVTRRVSATLEALAPAPRALALATAVLGDDVDLTPAAALAGLSSEAAVAAVGELTRSGLLADALPLRFRHPVLATAARATLSAPERARAHAQAAELLRARGEGPARVALHLLHAPPAGDAGVVGELRAAAAVALRRGAPMSAVALLRRALAEPPPPAERADLLLALGEVEYAVGSGPQAEDHLDEALRDADDPRLAARAQLLLLHARDRGGVEGMRRVRSEVAEALERVEPLDRELALRLRANLISLPGLSDEEFEEARRLATALPGATQGEAMLQSSVAFVAVWRDLSADGVAEIAERALGQAIAATREGLTTELVAGVLLALRWTDRLDVAHKVLDAAIVSAQERGSTTDFAIAVCQRGEVHRRAGRLSEGEADARAALAAIPDASWWYLGHTRAALVGTLTDQGRLDDAEQEAAAAPADATTDSPAHIPLILARMGLRAARGDHGAAVADWEEAVRRASRLRGISPAWIGDMAIAADAHEATGQTGAAAELRDRIDAFAQRWRTPAALAVAARVGGDLEGAVEHARRSPARIELARALVLRGVELRRAGRRVDCREPLREGHDLARECGATGLAEFARAELRASGVRIHRAAHSGRDSLTASEQRIAGLAAGGASNAEIAQSQFLTVKTVEMHLTRAYRKLGIAGRGELAQALSG